ncbi:MAG: hypothetical protein IKJ44_05825, partial [Elusimicrobiaceae bacterium]|nr:hypothetical protein [Elusimicrobiaceae bacterium]
MKKLFSKSAKKHTFRPKQTAFFQPSAGRGASRQEWTPIMDQKLALITFIFICFGLVFTYSSSAFDSSSYFTRQIVFDTIGVAAALFLSQFYVKIQRSFSPIWLMYITWGFLIAVLFTKPIA